MAQKTMHINLWTPEQVADYQYAREMTGITNDNDLVRFLFRRFRLQSERVLVDTPLEYEGTLTQTPENVAEDVMLAAPTGPAAAARKD